MKVQIPGFVAPVKAARVSINGTAVILRPRDHWPIFHEDAPELKGLEGLMGPLVVDYPAKAKPAAKKPEGGDAS